MTTTDSTTSTGTATSPTPATPAASVTESRFAALKAKLRELFELDKSDLDFGMYRIMSAKNEEVTAFLDRQLRDVVRETLAAHGAGATGQVQAELDEAIEQARKLGADPDTLPAVQALREKLESAGGASAAELEADIYNHLLAFFSRYYDEGDFISRRRYKGDTYAIPYAGEEVTLHWANKDQYYIKSGEWHKDYRFCAGTEARRHGGTKGSKFVRFRLVEATQEAGNNKEADDAKRRYILDAEQPVEVSENELTLRFQFRAPTDEDKQRAADGAVAIFGGDYARASNPKKGDEREQFCADAEQRALAAMPEAWKDLVTTVIAPEQATPTKPATATADKPARTLLGKHLDTFTARNTFDYFIHKDLGGFLRRELDFYIKNEIVRLDDLEKLPADHLARVQGKVKAVRAVAGPVIDLLAAVENFQKKMWLKKKLVLDTHWLVTVDRLPAELRDTVAQNAEQWAEWEKLGFKPAEAEDTGLFEGVKWGTRDYLDTSGGDKLVVDTRYFDDAFKSRLLASEEVLGGAQTIEDATTGVMVHGENFQALSTLSQRYHGAVDCAYIDPPYNTQNDDFRYKDRYQHSSWLSMATDRAELISVWLSPTGVLFSHIDDNELFRYKPALERVFGSDNFLCTFVWIKRYGPPPDTKDIGYTHEAIVAFRRSPQFERNLLPLTEDQQSRYRNPDKDPRGPWKPMDYTCRFTADERPNLYYAITNPNTGEEIWPKTSRVWAFSVEEHERNVADNRLWWGQQGTNKVPAFKNFLSNIQQGMMPTSVLHYDTVGHTDGAAKELRCFFPGIKATPKPSRLGEHLISIAAQKRSVILDCFAGTGPAGHAAISLNRRDAGGRRFVLVEMGNYFHTVLKPRITKVLYSPDWKDGRAQSHDKGMSALVKYFAIESYEDALNVSVPQPALVGSRGRVAGALGVRRRGPASGRAGTDRADLPASPAGGGTRRSGRPTAPGRDAGRWR